MQDDSPYLYKSALALEYDASVDDSPFLSIRGEGVSADLVVRLARKYGVPIVEKAQLARSLAFLDEGSSIPSELFKAVAVLFHEVEKLLAPR